MTPTSRPGLGRSAYRRPSISALPDVGRVRPTIIRIEVDLPAPFGPRKPVTRPAGTVKLMRSTTVCEPYCLVSCSMVIKGGAPRSSRCFDRRNACLAARRRQVADLLRPGGEPEHDLGPTPRWCGSDRSPGDVSRCPWPPGRARGRPRAAGGPPCERGRRTGDAPPRPADIASTVSSSAWAASYCGVQPSSVRARVVSSSGVSRPMSTQPGSVGCTCSRQVRSTNARTTGAGHRHLAGAEDRRRACRGRAPARSRC